MKIALFSLSNLFKVIGSTEPYYVAKYLAQNHELHAFIPRRYNGGATRETSRIAVRWVPILWGMPTFICYNFFVMFQMVGVLRQLDMIYTYKGVITPILLFKFLLGKKWVCDFRSAPVEQDIEFRKIAGRLPLSRWTIYRVGRLFYKSFLRYCDLVIVISEGVANELVKNYYVPSGKIHILPGGVDTGKFVKPDMGQNRDDETFKAIYIGSIARHRGLDTVIRALKQIERTIPLKLVIAGRGPTEDMKQLWRLAQELKVEEMIEWRGFIRHEEIPALLRECLVALSPLPDIAAYRVSVPAKVLEYLAAERIVVASDILAHRKLIENGHNGLLFKAEEPKTLADTIEMIYHNQELREQLQQHARESASQYDWNRLLSRLEERLQEVNRSPSEGRE